MSPTEGLPDDVLRDKIRAALIARVLPLIDAPVWAGTAQGARVCACCSLPIRTGDPEYEPRGAPKLCAHVGCFAAWREESELLRKARGAEPGTAAGA